jgi:hypothetical protein
MANDHERALRELVLSRERRQRLRAVVDRVHLLGRGGQDASAERPVRADIDFASEDAADVAVRADANLGDFNAPPGLGGQGAPALFVSPGLGVVGMAEEMMVTAA